MDKLSIVRLNIQLTKKCNQRCKSCNSYKMDSTNELSADEIKRIIKEVCSLYDIKNIAFTGGEPTIHKDILDVAKYAKKYSPNVSITTNGYYFKSEEKALELIDAGINRYSFSYHGIGVQDSFSRINGAEERIRKAIQWLTSMRKEKDIYLKVGMLFNGSNISEVEKMLDYVEDNDMDLYIEIVDYFSPIFAKSESAIETENAIKKDELCNAIEKIRGWIRNGRRINIDERALDFIYRYYMNEKIVGKCPLALTDIYIESNGNVRSGCWSLPPVGNVRTNSIETIMKSEIYKKNLERMLKRECSGCTCGYLMQSKYMED